MFLKLLGPIAPALSALVTLMTPCSLAWLRMSYISLCFRPRLVSVRIPSTAEHDSRALLSMSRSITAFDIL